MAHLPSLRWWQHAVALALLALPATAVAQISPTTPAHPNLPWGIGVATPQGQLIRYIYVPPQPVTLQYFVPGAPPAAEATPPPAEATPPAAQPAPPTAQPAPPTAQPAPPAAQPVPPTAQAAPPTAQPTPPTTQPVPPTAQAAPPTAQAMPPAAVPTPLSGAGDAKPPEDAAAGESAPAPPQIVYQQVTVPGYYVRETTAGFHYPERWMIEQVGPNTYSWRPLPAQFVPK
jgi:hypothetical protein